jgi:RimJ/RimL family protein N-acetyltransferase
LVKKKSVRRAVWGVAGLFVADSGSLIGTTSYDKLGEENSASQQSEISFYLDRVYWGQGLIGEAIWSPIPYVFDQMCIARIEAAIYPKNLRSTGVLLESASAWRACCAGAGCTAAVRAM